MLCTPSRRTKRNGMLWASLCPRLGRGTSTVCRVLASARSGVVVVTRCVTSCSYDIGNKVIEQPTKTRKTDLSALGLHHDAALSGVHAQYRSYLVACVGGGVRRRRHCRRRCRRRTSAARGGCGGASCGGLSCGGLGCCGGFCEPRALKPRARTVGARPTNDRCGGRGRGGGGGSDRRVARVERGAVERAVSPVGAREAIAGTMVADAAPHAVTWAPG